jgi:hypothetical protein
VTTTTPADLRTNLVGAWTLHAYEARSLDGSTVTYPLGTHPQGIIMYTPDGYMSAQLMRSDRPQLSGDDMHPDDPHELAAAAGGYLSYSGPYTVDGDDLIAHHITLSLIPNWIGGIQYRTAHLHGSILELSPPDPILIGGQYLNARLVWHRA